MIEWLTGKSVEWSDQPGKLVAIGSVLSFDEIKNGDVIWGSGLRSEGDVCRTNVKVLAVRGPMTRKKLLVAGIECPEVYGDPAVLMPKIYSPKIEKKYKWAVLPHYRDFYLVARHEGTILSVARSPFEVIDGILAAECLVTSSLHGAIIAEAYDIPVQYVPYTNQEPWFKVADYLASTGRQSFDEPIVPIDTETLVNAFMEYSRSGRIRPSRS